MDGRIYVFVYLPIYLSSYISVCICVSIYYLSIYLLSISIYLSAVYYLSTIYIFFLVSYAWCIMPPKCSYRVNVHCSTYGSAAYEHVIVFLLIFNFFDMTKENIHRPINPSLVLPSPTPSWAEFSWYSRQHYAHKQPIDKPIGKYPWMIIQIKRHRVRPLVSERGWLGNIACNFVGFSATESVCSLKRGRWMVNGRCLSVSMPGLVALYLFL